MGFARPYLREYVQGEKISLAKSAKNAKKILDYFCSSLASFAFLARELFFFGM